jgi:hypothetical protein
VERLVFRRTWSARLVPVAVGLAALALLGADALAGDLGLSAWTGIVGLVVALAAAGAVLAFGDEVVLDDGGIRTRNRLLSRLGLARFGLGRDRFLPWGGVLQMRAFHGLQRPAGGEAGGERRAPRALFLFPDSGRRLVLDSLQDMDRLQARLEECLRASGAPGEKDSL